jgi:MFS superfamily sulfate permease-like transporter
MGDFFGGAIAALIALPYGMAMASLMGLPPSSEFILHSSPYQSAFCWAETPF